MQLISSFSIFQNNESNGTSRNQVFTVKKSFEIYKFLEICQIQGVWTELRSEPCILKQSFKKKFQD